MDRKLDVAAKPSKALISKDMRTCGLYHNAILFMVKARIFYLLSKVQIYYLIATKLYLMG
jgi:hypothetical protein